MSASTVVLFPGQGAYIPGFAATAFDSHFEVRNLLAAIDAVAVEYGVQAVSAPLTDPSAPAAEQLMREDPGRWDLVVYAGSLVAYTVIAKTFDLTNAAMLGHSMGEIAALTAAGALTAAAGARVLCERAEVLRTAAIPDGGLVALEISADRAEALMAAVDLPSLYLAADNAPRQSVLVGDEGALGVVEAVCAAAGWRTRRLRSPRMYHCPPLEPARRRFAAAVSEIPTAPLRHPVYSPHHSRWYRGDENLLEVASWHLTLPVRYQSAVRYLHAHGADVFIESGARGALCDLAAASVPGIRTEAPFRGRSVPGGAIARSAVSEPKPAPVRTDVPLAATTAPDPALVSTVSTNGHNGSESVRVQDVTALPELRSRIVDLYASTLNYPADVFTDDAEFEADLGIDSVKQMDLLAQLAEGLGLPTPPQSFRIDEYNTVPAVESLVRQWAAREGVRA